MIWIGLILALLALSAGLVAAWLWWRSSPIQIAPLYHKLGLQEPIGGSPNDWIIGIIDAANASAAYNAKAALWTATSVVLSSASALLSSPLLQGWLS